MTAPTGRKMFFLIYLIEDWPRDWADYKKNYQATFTAQLLYPNIADYEVMPGRNVSTKGYTVQVPIATRNNAFPVSIPHRCK